MSKAKKITIKLTRIEADQLLHYARARETEGWYWGNREQFEKRHERIMEELNTALETHSE